MINIFYPPTHLNIQIDVLRDKMGMNVARYQEENIHNIFTALS